MRWYVIAIFSLVLSSDVHAQQQHPNLLWYNKPARDWNEALPIGNGRLGAMIFGRAGDELIQLNEQTLWTGGPVNLDPNPQAPGYLQQVRDELFRDSINQAVRLLKKMQGPNTEMYQPLGDIVIRQQYTGEPTQVYRDLDIGNALAGTRVTAGGITYIKEIFSSAPDQVIVIRLTASQPRSLNFSVNVFHELLYQKLVATGNELVLKGKARITNDERRNPKPFIYEDSQHCDGMRFQFRIKARNKDGTLSHTDSSLVIANATEVILLVSAATSFNGIDKCPDRDGKDEAKLATDYLQGALKKTYGQLKAAHVADHKKYFDRVVLRLNNSIAPALPTNERLANYQKGQADDALEELYFQFGRYLLISSSRPGGFPANLQGIWNNLIRPSWRSNYTTNINLQMNYWLALPGNMEEMNRNLVEHIMRMAVHGTATARNYYHMRGWTVHHNSDMWAQTNPVGEGIGDPKWAAWSLGSAWLSQHLYEQYRFTADKKYLRDTAYPLMRTAAEFCLDWLVEKDGWLVTAPSSSPENVYLHPNGFKGTVTIASAMDMEIIWDLFTNIIEAATILNIDKDFIVLLEKQRAKLRPLQVGKKGNLVEWYGDWEDEDPLHRHVSHAFALHPGRQISPLIDTSFANAIRQTLLIRGDGGTGWSKAWKINFWARLLDGPHAYKMYQELLKTSTLNNLFDTHPPFQIDGNFGATAGIIEMLLQSHLSTIQILPALPPHWKVGRVKGLVARGNFEIAFDWSDGKLLSGEIISRKGGECSLRTAQPITVMGATQVTQVISSDKKEYTTRFQTRAGSKYKMVVKK